MHIVNSYRREIIIQKHMSEQRIDNFLFKNFKNLPKSMIYRSLRVGKIKINNKRVHPKYKLKINDSITIYSINTETKKKKFI